MRIFIFIAMFFIIAGLMILANNDLPLYKQENTKKFLNLYSDWNEKIFSNIFSLGKEVIEMEWMP
jgi:hypothetical protein